MRNDILHRMRAALDTLSRSERQVAEWVLAYPRDALKASLGELACASGVSEPTVIRFCRSLGLSGYREMRTHLALAVQQPDSFAHHDVTSEDPAATAVGKVLDNAVRALVDVRASIELHPWQDAVTALAAARQILFVGLGASGMVAQDACHKFFRLGIPCSTALDAQTIAQRAAIAESRDVVIACSHTGRWPHLASAMEAARSRGAVVIAITDPDAPLASVANLVFACAPPEDTSIYTPMTSRMAHLALLDALQVALALELGESATERLRSTKEGLRALLGEPPPAGVQA